MASANAAEIKALISLDDPYYFKGVFEWFMTMRKKRILARAIEIELENRVATHFHFGKKTAMYLKVFFRTVVKCKL